MSRHLAITGASRGIGRQTARLYAKRGYSLSVIGRDSPALRELVSELAEAGTSVRALHCDLGIRSEADSVFSQLAAGPAPDVVIHNAGMIERAAIVGHSDELWDAHFEVNVTAPMRLTRAVLPEMLARKSGRVLFVSSISAVMGTKAQSAYNSSKAALLGLMRCLAEELSDTGLMTAAVLPGSVDTEMLSGSGFAPRMTADEVARTLFFLGVESSVAHNGAIVEMYGV